MTRIKQGVNSNTGIGFERDSMARENISHHIRDGHEPW
jgi:hypothetical protein